MERTAELLRTDVERLEVLVRQLQGAVVAPKILPVSAVLPTVGLVDGQEAYFQNAAMAALGIVWHVRYRLAAAHWEFVGGEAWRLKATAGFTCAAANTWETVGTGIVPRFTTPQAGLYRWRFGCRFQCSISGATESYMGLGVVGSGPFDNIRRNTGTVSVGQDIVTTAYETEQSMAAAQVVAVMHNTQTAAANVSYVGQWVHVTPVYLT